MRKGRHFVIHFDRTFRIDASGGSC